MITSQTDTIAAIATPIGEGGISVIRVSGPDAVRSVDSQFAGRSRLADALSHTAHFGIIRDKKGSPIDEAVCTVFLGPHSYTGEETVEVSCHGGVFVTRRILETLLAGGVRQAEPGEFTKRAFLNGRMDLAQAEAVADLIHARSEKAREASLRQLEGSLSKVIHEIRGKLIEALGLLELELDFSEDGYELIDKSKVARMLESAGTQVQTLVLTYKEGRVFNEGVRVVLAGAPNVGKSSLLNALLNENRAIVTDVPGTTRDTIEEGASIGGILFRLVDTAGLRETEDQIEREGVRRTEYSIANSDMVLFVLDSSRIMTEEERSVLQRLRQSHADSTIVVVNKNDLAESRTEFETSGVLIIRISAKTHVGLDELKKQMVQTALPSSALGESSVVVTNSRHHTAFVRTHEGLLLALESVRSGAGGELISIDIRRALEALAEIVGEVTTEEILNAVFSRFCIGK